MKLEYLWVECSGTSDFLLNLEHAAILASEYLLWSWKILFSTWNIFSWSWIFSRQPRIFPHEYAMYFYLLYLKYCSPALGSTFSWIWNIVLLNSKKFQPCCKKKFQLYEKNGIWNHQILGLFQNSCCKKHNTRFEKYIFLTFGSCHRKA